MAFFLNEIVPWGRSFNEYVRMFDLNELHLKQRILGCGDGPAAFNAELTRQGGKVVSCDPLYSYSRNEIDFRISECFDTVLEQARLNVDAFIWTHGISTVEELGRVRMQAMATFLDDYTDGQAQQRYVATALPDLPFDSNRFDLALCSHFLFLYGSLGLNFHIRSVLDLVRVAREARIFPLLQLDRERSPFLDAVISEVRNLGYVAEITRVAYEFQKDANEMLVVKRCEVT